MLDVGADLAVVLAVLEDPVAVERRVRGVLAPAPDGVPRDDHEVFEVRVRGLEGGPERVGGGSEQEEWLGRLRMRPEGGVSLACGAGADLGDGMRAGLTLDESQYRTLSSTLTTSAVPISSTARLVVLACLTSTGAHLKSLPPGPEGALILYCFRVRDDTGYGRGDGSRSTAPIGCGFSSHA